MSCLLAGRYPASLVLDEICTHHEPIPAHIAGLEPVASNSNGISPRDSETLCVSTFSTTTQPPHSADGQSI